MIEPAYAPPPDDGLSLIYQDEYLLVVDKPAGLLTVPGRGVDKQDCLFTRVQQVYADVLVVHRLDMATSGLVIFARGVEIQKQLSIMFSERAVQKSYVALVAGTVTPETGEIDLPIMADWPNRPRQKVDTESGKPSLTRYQALNTEQTNTRLKLTPITGRTHQLRVHLTAIGHPIVGDTLYDGFAAPRLMLHAEQLCFKHPSSAKLLTLSSESPF